MRPPIRGAPLTGVSKDTPGRWLKLRVLMLGAVFALLLLVAFGRAVKLQIQDRE